MYARRTRIFFPEQECDPVTVLVCIYLTLLQRKSCSVHMTVFKIVVHQLDTIIGMMYLGADNSSRLYGNIHSYAHCMICFDAIYEMYVVLLIIEKPTKLTFHHGFLYGHSHFKQRLACPKGYENSRQLL